MTHWYLPVFFKNIGIHCILESGLVKICISKIYALDPVIFFFVFGYKKKKKKKKLKAVFI